MRIHPTVNVSKVKPYIERLPGQTVNRPGPVFVTEEGHVEWEVDLILNSRKTKKDELEYLVRWKGYDEDQDTWEPEKHLENAKRKIAEFHCRKTNAPRRMRGISLERFRNLFKSRDEDLTTHTCWCALDWEIDEDVESSGGVV